MRNRIRRTCKQLSTAALIIGFSASGAAAQRSIDLMFQSSRFRNENLQTIQGGAFRFDWGAVDTGFDFGRSSRLAFGATCNQGVLLGDPDACIEENQDVQSTMGSVSVGLAVLGFSGAWGSSELVPAIGLNALSVNKNGLVSKRTVNNSRVFIEALLMLRYRSPEVRSRLRVIGEGRLAALGSRQLIGCEDCGSIYLEDSETRAVFAIGFTWMLPQAVSVADRATVHEGR